MASPPPPTGYSYPKAPLSPPYTAYSSSNSSQPPSINTMTNKKRASEGGAPGPSPSLKRRKASAISLASAAGGGSAHPLRQTSFPPDEPGTPFSARSPSVDFDNMSMISGSQVGVVGPPKKKRGRKSKAEKAREQTPSVVGGRGNIADSDVGGRSGTKGSAAGGEEEEVENDGPTEVSAAASSLTKEQQAIEKKAKNVLVEQFGEKLFARYEFWRLAGLNKAAIRRLVNATISQSVSENIVVTVRAISKLYLGDLVETARRVQLEWIARTGEKQIDVDLPAPLPAAAAPPGAPTGSQEVGAVTLAGDQGKNNDAPPLRDPEVGPLRPEHLREALRRYKLAHEGGGVGGHKIWNLLQQSGVERFPTRTGGRRIFR